MIFHVITPFARTANHKKLGAMLQNQGVASWILLLHPGQAIDLERWSGWCRTVTLDIPKTDCVAATLCNRFLLDYDFRDDQWYCFLCDDDWIPAGFFSGLAKKIVPKDKLAIVGMLRGNSIPTNPGHPTWPLIPSPDSLRYGFVGFEQGIFEGGALRDYRSNHAIGLADPNELVLITMAKERGAAFIPDLNVWFNYLEPGRWDEAGVTGMYD